MYRRNQRPQIKREKQYNPFEVEADSKELMSTLKAIDDRCLRSTFKTLEDPINYAFDIFESAPLKTLATDFIKESFSDLVSFVSEICK